MANPIRPRHTSRASVVATSLFVGLLAAVGVVAFAPHAGGSTVQPRYAPTGTHVVTEQSGASIAGLTNAPTTTIPSSAITELASFNGGAIGDVWTDRAKALLPEDVVWGATVYAAPSSTGQACYVVAGGPSSCVPAFTQAVPIAYAKFDRDGPGGDPVTVAGLAPDDVTAIDVEAGTSTYQAHLSNNAFFFQLPSGDTEAVTGLVVKYGDDTSLRMPLAPLKSESG